MSAADKLQAALNHDWADPDKDLADTYLQRCRRWYAGLRVDQREIVELVRKLFGEGKEAEAERLADVLPPAPRFPL
jgi:hypothetical protein